MLPTPLASMFSMPPDVIAITLAAAIANTKLPVPLLVICTLVLALPSWIVADSNSILPVPLGRRLISPLRLVDSMWLSPSCKLPVEILVAKNVASTTASAVSSALRTRRLPPSSLRIILPKKIDPGMANPLAPNSVTKLPAMLTLTLPPDATTATLDVPLLIAAESMLLVSMLPGVVPSGPKNPIVFPPVFLITTSPRAMVLPARYSSFQRAVVLPRL